MDTTSNKSTSGALTTNKLLEILAREKLAQPPEWKGHKFSIENFGGPGTYYMVQGAVAPLITRGKNKGRPNWRKLDKLTDLSIPIMPSELAELKKRLANEGGAS